MGFPSVLKQIEQSSTGPRINIKPQLELSWELEAALRVPPQIRHRIHRLAESVMRGLQSPREQEESHSQDFPAA